jgi:hypothetical protein
MSHKRVEVSATLIQLNQIKKAISLLYDWASKQNRSGWHQYGVFITCPREESRFVFTFIIAGDFNLSTGQLDEIIQILKDSGMLAPMTLFDPRPASS